jgi:hypothetical protein
VVSPFFFETLAAFVPRCEKGLRRCDFGAEAVVLNSERRLDFDALQKFNGPL